MLAANCPGIHNLQTLERMNDCAREWCIYICYAGRISNSIRDLLWEEIMGERLKGKSFDVAFPFNILYLRGHYPHLKFIDEEYSYEEETDIVIENFRKYFAIFGKRGWEVNHKLKKLIYNVSTNGHLKENPSYKTAVMWWNVNDTGKKP